MADHLSANLLARVVPAQIVHEVLDKRGCNSRRIRSFPAVAGAYCCMALSLYPDAAYEEVFAAVAQGLAWAAGAAEPARVAKSSISALRTRIGSAPIKELVQRCCTPLLDPRAILMVSTPACAWSRWTAVASNCPPKSASSRPSAGRGAGQASPLTRRRAARCLWRVACGSHAILGANLDAYRTDEWQVCAPLLEHLQPDMLCLADRGFDGFAYWQQARARGVQLLWRCMKDRTLPVLRELDDGSYPSAICPPSSDRGRARATQESIVVRVIEYSLPGVPAALGHDAPEPRYRLITSLLDPATAPARELAAVYHERWHVEGAFDEMKTHLLQARRVLRSKTADLVRQEFYGWVLAHYAVRWLLHQGADLHGLAHRERSFSGHLQLMRRTQPLSGAFSPRAAHKTT